MRKFPAYLFVFMIILIIGATALITRSLTPFYQARSATIEVAERRADLVEAEDFYWYNGNETFFTITGKNSANEEIVVIVQQDGGEVNVFQQSEIISRKHAVSIVYELENPEHILETRIGIYKGIPIWEVSFRQDNGRLGYTLLMLETGEWVRTIKNI